MWSGVDGTLGRTQSKVARSHSLERATSTRLGSRLYLTFKIECHLPFVEDNSCCFSGMSAVLNGQTPRKEESEKNNTMFDTSTALFHFRKQRGLCFGSGRLCKLTFGS